MAMGKHGEACSANASRVYAAALCRHRNYFGVVSGCLNDGICADRDQCFCVRAPSILHEVEMTAPEGTTGYTGSDCSIGMSLSCPGANVTAIMTMNHICVCVCVCQPCACKDGTTRIASWYRLLKPALHLAERGATAAPMEATAPHLTSAPVPRSGKATTAAHVSGCCRVWTNAPLWLTQWRVCGCLHSGVHCAC